MAFKVLEGRVGHPKLDNPLHSPDQGLAAGSEHLNIWRAGEDSQTDTNRRTSVLKRPR